MGLKETVQNLQDAYSQLLELMIVMVDSNKKVLSFSNKRSEENLHVNMVESIPNLSKIKNTIYVDFLPGLKVLVAPVKVQGQNPIYLIGGIIVEEGALKTVKDYLLEQPEGETYLRQLETYSVLTKEEKEKKLTLFHQLSKAIESIYHSHENVDIFRKQFSTVDQAAQYLTSETISLDKLLQQFKEMNPAIEFVGLAINKGNERYVIQHYIGQNKEGIIGAEIPVGEGFLGQAAVSEEFSFWGDIEEDPRVLIFREYGLSPDNLFSHPIKIENQTKGLWFGGSSKKNTSYDADMIRIFSSFMGIFMNQQQLKENMNNHLLQLSTFNEIFNVMTNVKNIKRVLYILIDMGMNILTGQFACVIYKESQEDSKLSVISRGMKNDFFSHYGRDLGRRFFGQTNKEPKAHFQYLEDGKLSYEMPIMYRDELFGVLSIGVQSEEEVIPFAPFLSSLTVAGGISIYLLQHETGPQTDEKVIGVLANLLKKNDPEKYEQSQKAQELVRGFGNEIQLSSQQLETLKMASYLYFYDEDIVKSSISNMDIKELLHHLGQVKNGEIKGFEHPAVKMLAVIFLHLGEKMTSNIEHEILNDPLYHQFERWLTRNHTIESEIEIWDDVQLESEPVLEKQELKEKMNLSNREMEVLHQVLKGFNNREIASSLFISDHTVKNHMTNILQKLGVTDRSQAIAKVYQMGYIPQ